MNNMYNYILMGVFIIAGIAMFLTSKSWISVLKPYSATYKEPAFIAAIGLFIVLLTVIDVKLGLSLAFFTILVGIKLYQEGFAVRAPIRPIGVGIDTPNATLPPLPTNAEADVKAALTEGFQADNTSPETVIAEKMDKQMQLPTQCSPSDFNTYSQGTDYQGYDVVSCRYDLKAGTQNSTIYGPPLSWCETYAATNLPVPFYPLTA